ARGAGFVWFWMVPESERREAGDVALRRYHGIQDRHLPLPARRCDCDSPFQSDRPGPRHAGVEGRERSVCGLAESLTPFAAICTNRRRKLVLGNVTRSQLSIV